MRLLAVGRLVTLSQKCASSSAAVRLAYDQYGDKGDTNAPPLVIAHGLFGHKSNWKSVSRALQAKLKNQVFTVDMRNHGQSPWTDTMTYNEMAGDLALFVQEVVQPESGSDSICLLGHSMGGKAAIVFSLDHPSLLDRLIIEDVAPKVHVKQRSQVPGVVEAMQAAEQHFASYGNISEARQAVDEKLQEVIKELEVRQFLLTNLYEKSDNTIGWRVNLKAISGFLDDIMGFSIIAECSPSFKKPTLFMTGSTSPYVTVEDFDLIRHYFPKAQFDVIAGAGHWIHVEKPYDFIHSVHRFMIEK